MKHGTDKPKKIDTNVEIKEKDNGRMRIKNKEKSKLINRKKPK